MSFTLNILLSQFVRQEIMWLQLNSAFPLTHLSLPYMYLYQALLWDTGLRLLNSYNFKQNSYRQNSRADFAFHNSWSLLFKIFKKQLSSLRFCSLKLYCRLWPRLCLVSIDLFLCKISFLYGLLAVTFLEYQVFFMRWSKTIEMKLLRLSFLGSALWQNFKSLQWKITFIQLFERILLQKY